MVSDSMKVLTVVLVVVYFIICVAIALKTNKTNTTVKQYFISGKNVGLFFLFFTCFASFCGSGNFIGYAGRTAVYGVGAYWNFMGDIVLGYIAFSIFLAPYLAKFDYITMPQFITHYLVGNDMTVRRLSGISAAIGNIAICGMQIMGMSYMFTAALGVQSHVAVIISGAITVTYSAIGGMDGIILNDAIQGMLQLFVVVFVIVFSLKIMNFDLSWLFTEVNKVDPQLTTIWGGYTWKQCISNFLTGFFGSMTNPIMWNRAFVAKDVKTAKSGFWLATAACIICTFFVMSIGFLARVLNNDVGDQATIWMIVNQMPSWFLPFAVVGLTAAIMDTSAAHLNAGVANLVCDCIDPDEKLPPKQSIRLSKTICFISGAVAMVGAVVAPSLLDLSYLGLVILGATLFPVFIIGYFLRDKTSKEFRSNISIKAVRCAMLVGLIVTACFQLIPSLADVIGGGIIPGMLSTTVIILVLNKVFKPEYPIVKEARE